MHIGIPREVKSFENRVGMTPASVREAVADGHTVTVETNAGHTIGFDDAQYEAAGAKIAATAKDTFDNAEMIVKVKEPQPEEIGMLRDGQILFTYLHLTKLKFLSQHTIKKSLYYLKDLLEQEKQDLLSICLGIFLKKEKNLSL